MRAVVQRVERCSVSVAEVTVGAIERGLCVLVGVDAGDTEADADALADKVIGLRIFPDVEGKMNLDVREAGGAVLAVSQFTLLGDVRRGRRPSFSRAMAPEPAHQLFGAFCAGIERRGVALSTGRFREHMLVRIDNDGPVTILIDSKRAF
ncbi:MAG TPA: D-aminoacyl-tRNA deacylase [Polyangiaceae bacterium]|jgi:D-tyrosyl-tRNA(Tyr) deacylase